MIEIVHTCLYGLPYLSPFLIKISTKIRKMRRMNLFVFLVSTTILNPSFFSILAPGSPTSPDHKTKRQSDPTPFGFKGT